MNTTELAKTGTKKNKKRLSLIRDEKGLSTVEYLILLALIAAAGVGVWTTFGGQVRDGVTAQQGALGGIFGGGGGE